jgi:hypothetical protein
MASNGQGLTATWGTVTLGELVSISVDGIAADLVEATPRSLVSKNAKKFLVADTDLGTASLTLRGTAVPSSSVGLTGALSITGPAVAWVFSRAIVQSLGWSVKAGELQEYSLKFKLSGT